MAKKLSRFQLKQQKLSYWGSGANCIAQGVEFHYCCVHASWAVWELGYESLILNCNPETVRTYYDTSDSPVLIDPSLKGPVEVDMELLGDGTNSEMEGIIEHVEHTGINSGDNACILPPQNLSSDVLRRLEEQRINPSQRAQCERIDEHTIYC